MHPYKSDSSGGGCCEIMWVWSECSYLENKFYPRYEIIREVGEKIAKYSENKSAVSRSRKGVQNY